MSGARTGRASHHAGKGLVAGLIDCATGLRSTDEVGSYREAKPLNDYRVELTLTDGREVVRDPRPLLVGPVFAEIRNHEARFREMRVEGGTLVWPNGADLCPDVLIWAGLPPADAASDAA